MIAALLLLLLSPPSLPPPQLLLLLLICYQGITVTGNIGATSHRPERKGFLDGGDFVPTVGGFLLERRSFPRPNLIVPFFLARIFIGGPGGVLNMGRGFVTLMKHVPEKI